MQSSILIFETYVVGGVFPQWLHGYGTGVIVPEKTDHMGPLPLPPILSDP